MQYLSLGPPMVYRAPPALGLSLCRMYTDEIGKVARDHPDRFVGFAASVTVPRARRGRARPRRRSRLAWSRRRLERARPINQPVCDQIQMLDLPLFIHPINPLGQPHIHDYRLDYRRLPEGPHRRT
jgi:hypothetical protein